MKTKSKSHIDRAVATVLRRLDHIECCASGMPGYEYTARKCNAIRKGLLSTESVPSDLREIVERRTALVAQNLS
jgi:hypothetical protein